MTEAALAERQAVTIIHRRAEVIIIIITTVILPTGYSTGFPGRTAAVPSATTGALLSHSATSGRTTIADSSLSVSVVTGRATLTGDITGMDGTLIAGTAITRLNT